MSQMRETCEIMSTHARLPHEWRFCVAQSILIQYSVDSCDAQIGINRVA